MQLVRMFSAREDVSEFINNKHLLLIKSDFLVLLLTSIKGGCVSKIFLEPKISLEVYNSSFSNR